MIRLLLPIGISHIFCEKILKFDEILLKISPILGIVVFDLFMPDFIPDILEKVNELVVWLLHVISDIR